MLKPVAHELAQPMKIAATAIDSGGHFTSEVYAYARDRAAQGVIAIKGMSTKGKPPMGEGGDEEAVPASERGESSVGHRAAQDAIDAIKGGDAAGLYDALERVVAACNGAGGEEE